MLLTFPGEVGVGGRTWDLLHANRMPSPERWPFLHGLQPTLSILGQGLNSAPLHREKGLFVAWHCRCPQNLPLNSCWTTCLMLAGFLCGQQARAYNCYFCWTTTPLFQVLSASTSLVAMLVASPSGAPIGCQFLIS